MQYFEIVKFNGFNPEKNKYCFFVWDENDKIYFYESGITAEEIGQLLFGN